MPYTGNDPNLQDLQAQITDLQTQVNTKVSGLQSQIKQVTLSLEGTLATIKSGFDALKAYVLTKIPN